MQLGAFFTLEENCDFCVWAPFAKQMTLLLKQGDQMQSYEMNCDEKGYWTIRVDKVPVNSRYTFLLNNETELPDPASFNQPEGINHASALLDHRAFQWTDSSWQAPTLKQYILYELHIGTFTQEGTFDSAIEKLAYLQNLGITAIEVMPVAVCSGKRNWGYDGVFPYAVSPAYGGPQAFKRFVNACHGAGLAVVLDVVYNHIGPEGNVLPQFGPYFSNSIQTPWGPSLNFDEAYSDEVCSYFIENACYWFEHFHIDALRLDAIQGIYDRSANPFLSKLSQAVFDLNSQLKKKHYIIAESDRNDLQVTRGRSIGGNGLDANWCDDMHHALHAYFTGEQQGYYIDFGDWEHLVKSIEQGYWFGGNYCIHRRRRHGNFTPDFSAERLIVFGQNHDQIGNRVKGDRLATLMTPDQYRLMAVTILLSPFIPLLFMGEEYGETNPFYYFVDHQSSELLEAVRQGRQREFETFNWKEGSLDPGAQETFEASKLDWTKMEQHEYGKIFRYYKRVIQIRRENEAFLTLSKEKRHVTRDDQKKCLIIEQWGLKSRLLFLFNFDKQSHEIELDLNMEKGTKMLDSSDTIWGGNGSQAADEIYQASTIKLSSTNCVVYQLDSVKEQESMSSS